MADQIGPLKQTVYILDTNVLGLVAQADPQVIADLQSFKSSGIKLVVPHHAMVEINRDPEPIRKAIQLAFIRDFGIEVQAPSSKADRLAYIFGPEYMPQELRKEYFKNYPELQGQTVSPEAIRRFYEENPKILRGITTDTLVGDTDVLIFADANRYSMNEGKGKNVKLHTCERVAGVGPKDNDPKSVVPQQKRKAAIARIWKVDLSPESRAMPRIPKYVAIPEVLWESIPELQDKPITSKIINPDGSLARNPTPPPRPSTPSGQLQYKGQIGLGLKLGGMELAVLVVKVILEAVLRKVFEKDLEEFTKKSFNESCAPLITRDLRDLGNKLKILEIVTKGETAFASVKLLYYSWEKGLMAPASPDDVPNPHTWVAYQGLTEITTRKIDPPRSTPYQESNWVTPNRVGAIVECSIGPVSYSEEEKILYVSYNKVIDLLSNLARGAEAAAQETNAPEDLHARDAWGARHSELLAKRERALRDTGDPIYL